MKRSACFLTIAFAVVILALAAADARNPRLNGTIFEDLTEQAGFDHQGHGKCIAMGDYDLDGDLDIYVSVVYGRNKFFQNEGGFRFKNMAPALAVDSPYDTHAVVFADFDNNGYLDIFCANNLEALTKQRGEVLQPNDFYLGFDEGFVESARKAGLAGSEFNFSCGATTADVNGDGLLDIYVAKGGYRKGADCANSLYVNNGDGTYRDIARQAGVADEGNGYCCAFADYDNDGDPDLYAGNINDTDKPVTRILYRNNGDGTFTDVTREAGLEGRGNNISCCWGDFDNDGDLDLYLGNSTGPGHPEDVWMKDSLFRNNGDGTFSDVSGDSGIALPTNTRGSTIGDIDNDGDLDIIANNSWADSNIFLNDGTGKFADAAKTTGGAVFYGHGSALGDLDGDGDLDLAAGNWRRPSARNPGLWRLFRNKTNNADFLKIDVEGTRSGRSAVMTRIWVYEAGRIKDGNYLRGFRFISAGNGTFPGNPLQAHFGVSALKKYDVVVVFPSGAEVQLKNVAAAQTLKIREPEK